MRREKQKLAQQQQQQQRQADKVCEALKKSGITHQKLRKQQPTMKLLTKSILTVDDIKAQIPAEFNLTSIPTKNGLYVHFIKPSTPSDFTTLQNGYFYWNQVRHRFSLKLSFNKFDPESRTWKKCLFTKIDDYRQAAQAAFNRLELPEGTLLEHLVNLNDIPKHLQTITSPPAVALVTPEVPPKTSDKFSSSEDDMEATSDSTRSPDAKKKKTKKTTTRKTSKRSA